MDSSYRVESNDSTARLHSSNPLLKSCKTYGFAIAIIIGIGIGIGGLAVGGVGAAGYFGGAISNLSQVHAIIMMAAGGGVCGAILFIFGVVGTVKKCRNNTLEDTSGSRARQPVQVNKQEIIRTTDTQNGLVYGADAWRIWGADVLDEVPPAPAINWDENDPYFNEAYRNNYVLLYIPQGIRVGREEKALNLQTLREISGGPFEYFSKSVAKQFGSSSSYGWVLVSKKVIPDSRRKRYKEQKQMVEEQEGFRMPQTMEAIAANLMVFAFTNASLYGEQPLTDTRCAEQVDGRYPVVVGGFSPVGFVVFYDRFDYVGYGVAALRKF